jgi:uncharacterized protein YecA (UPF0149 family)
MTASNNNEQMTAEQLFAKTEEKEVLSEKNKKDAEDKAMLDNVVKTLKSFKKVGRNEPCPCGAKKADGSPVKFKKCCINKVA